MYMLFRYGRSQSVHALIASQKLLGYHVAADGAEVVVEVGDDDVDFTLGVVAAGFKGLGDFFKDDEFFFSLGGDALKLAVFKEAFDDFLAVGFITLVLEFLFFRLFLQNIENRYVKYIAVDGVDGVVLLLAGGDGTDIHEFLKVKRNRGGGKPRRSERRSTYISSSIRDLRICMRDLSERHLNKLMASNSVMGHLLIKIIP